jgi:rhodanese-related sulfurtransferase
MITKQELKDLLVSNEPFTLLDVRGEDEWKAGHIDDAILMPHWFVQLKVGDLVANKDAKIVVYCLSGGRSAVAAKTLDDMGYTNVWNLEGGYSEFQP